MGKQMRKILFYILLFVFIFFSVELLSIEGLDILKKIRDIEYKPIFPISLKHKTILQKLLSETRSYLRFDPTLGWTIRPNSESENHLYRSNPEGIRADHSYPVDAPLSGYLRLAAFGGSFAHCDDVANAETWESQLESLDHHLEVLNFGVCGYGLDQAFLRYKEDGCKFHPNIVFIGFMSKDISRLVSTFRPFYFSNTGIPLGKPRFVLRADKLILLENPLSTQQDLERLLHNDLNVFNKLKANDYYAAQRYSKSPFDFLASVRLMTIAINHFKGKDRQDEIFNNGVYNTSSEAYELTTKLIDEFYLSAESNSSLPVVMLFPQRSDIEMYIKNGKTSYLPLIEYLKEKGYRYIDLLIPLKTSINKGVKIERLILTHNSAKANRLIAQFIYSYLQDQHLLEKTSVGMQ